MYIKNLNLQNFRNYDKEIIEFSPKMNIIYGHNGQGKTNIVEALYFFQSGKSFRCLKDREAIKFGEDYFKIQALFETNQGSSDALVFVQDKKSVRLNGIQLEKLSELVGEYNMVIFTPDYLNLIKDGPGVRRQFIDSFISQIKPTYFKNLISYYRVLKQRNNVLKQKSKNMISTLDIWDEKLASLGVKINQMRSSAIDKINETINIVGDGSFITEKIKLIYTPSVKGDYEDKNNFLHQLYSSRERDFEKGITLTGPHRDDFEIFMNDMNIKKYGSQGQMRSCVLKLKLSECEIIKEKKGDTPILLLDDILSELDEKRRKFFLENIKDKQVIITCTEKENIKSDDCYVFRVENGKVIKE